MCAQKTSKPPGRLVPNRKNFPNPFKVEVYCSVGFKLEKYKDGWSIYVDRVSLIIFLVVLLLGLSLTVDHLPGFVELAKVVNPA